MIFHLVAVCLSLGEYKQFCILLTWVNKFTEMPFYTIHHFIAGLLMGFGIYGLIIIPRSAQNDSSTALLNTLTVFGAFLVEYYGLVLANFIRDILAKRMVYYRLKYGTTPVNRLIIRCLPKVSYKGGGPFFTIASNGLLLFLKAVFDLILLLLVGPC